MTLTRRLACIGGVSVVLSACGFRPRQPLSYRFQVILIPTNPSMLLTELRRSLAADPRVEVLQDLRQFERADLWFDLLQESREKIVVGRNTAGGVREFQLRLRTRFRLTTPQGRELIPETELSLLREIGFT